MIDFLYISINNKAMKKEIELKLTLSQWRKMCKAAGVPSKRLQEAFKACGIVIRRA